MRKTSFLALILTAAVFLLVRVAPANTKPLAHFSGNVLDSLRLAAQDPSPEPWPSRPPAPPAPAIHVEIDPPEIDLPQIEPPEIEPPEIETVEVDVHPEEIEQYMDHDDADHDDIDIDHNDPALNVRAEEKIEKSFPMPSAHRTLEIDNVWGSIEVVGASIDQ